MFSKSASKNPSIIFFVAMGGKNYALSNASCPQSEFRRKHVFLARFTKNIGQIANFNKKHKDTCKMAPMKWI